MSTPPPLPHPDPRDDPEFNKWRWQWRRRIAIAQHQYPPQLVLAGARVLNVFTEELVEADVAIDAGMIASIGLFPEAGERIELPDRIIAPSFTDAHFHLESSLLWPPELARVVVPHGTGAIVTDPHEMANVAGLAGIEAMRAAAEGLPLDIRFTVPSCVPASEHESPGARLSRDEIATMLDWPETVALGEMMNNPGLLNADPGIAAKLWTARSRGVDGHAPGLKGDALQAYAGSGISSDHESVAVEEAREKLRAGMMLMLREGSSEKNLRDLLPLVTDQTYPHICFASDDRDCHDLLANGHVDDILRIAIDGGLDPVRAIRMATWNPARHYGMDGLGAVAAGYRANLVVLRDLDPVDVEMTLFNGRVVARDGALIVDLPDHAAPPELRGTVNVAPVRRSDLVLHRAGATQAIEVIPGQIVTRCIDVEPPGESNIVSPSIEADLLKIVSVERHHASGRVGVALVRGFGLTSGAIASTIAHDAHNIVAVGTNDDDLLSAIATVAEAQGGLAVIDRGRVLAHLGLPIAGLMTDAPVSQVADAYAAAEDAARRLGSSLDSPFGQLAFMSLSVIPEARITDRGFLDLRS
jgi:adenine deaminase